MKNNNANSAGFTLVEIVVVVFISAIILPAIILPFVEGIQKINLPVIQGTMTLLAQEEMEKYITPSGYDVSGWSSRDIDEFDGYQSLCSVIYVSPGAFDTETAGDSGYKRVTISITYDIYSYSLVTIKTDWNNQS